MARRLESSIEKAVVNYHKKRFGKDSVVKLNGLGKRSHPDRMFLGRGRALFIEFKREGEKPTPLQAHLHAEWKKLGWTVYVIDSVDEGKKLLDWTFRDRPDLEHPL
jgi:hypothetical protein